MRIKITHYVLLSFFVILLLFSITTYNDYRLANHIGENEQYLNRSSEVVRNCSHFQLNFLFITSALRGFFLTGQGAFIHDYDSVQRENQQIIKTLDAEIDDSTQKKLLGHMVAINNHEKELYEQLLSTTAFKTIVGDSDILGLNKAYKQEFTGSHGRAQDTLLDIARQFVTREYFIRQQKKNGLDRTAAAIATTSYTLTIVSIIIACLVILFLIIKIAARIKQMTAMADAISKGNYNINISAIGADELSPLGVSLNRMAGKLSHNIALLTQTNEELGQFAHIVSHDMKSPLRGISNVVGWIEEDCKNELSPKLDEYIQLIKGRVNRAENLIEGILSYSRIGKEQLVKQEVDVYALVNSVIEDLPDKKNAVFEVGPMPVMVTEKILLLQIFTNLISNAIKYNDKKQPEIKLYSERENNYYRFFVEDNGMGIAEPYHQRIFDIFQTLQDRDSFESTGVGLAIVKKILDSKKQTIQLQSELTKGSIFSFTWPE